MNKKMRIFKMMTAVMMQVILAIVFAFTEIEISPYLYLILWCGCAKMILSALTFEHAI